MKVLIRWQWTILTGVLWIITGPVGAQDNGPENNAIVCSDGIDNDGDGQSDCDDTECAADPYCTTCVELPTPVLACTGAITGLNIAAGSTDANNSYACGGWDASGSEIVYEWTATVAGTYQIGLCALSCATVHPAPTVKWLDTSLGCGDSYVC